MSNKPEDKKENTITSEQASKPPAKPATGELTEKDLDKVAGGSTEDPCGGGQRKNR